MAIVGFLVWSLWAEIDQITRARGEVIPSGRVQIVQSEEGGTIAQMLVREGDRVKRGQFLVRLDEVRPGAAVEESRAKAAGLMAKMARIRAELLNQPLQFPAYGSRLSRVRQHAAQPLPPSPGRARVADQRAQLDRCRWSGRNCR